MGDKAKQELQPKRGRSLSSVPKLEQEIERFFGGRWPKLFEWPTPQSMFESQLPSVDVIDRESEVCVRAEMPGFKKKEIDISVSDKTLTIKANSESESTEEEGDYHRQEISRGYLARTVALPAEVDGDQAKAKLRDGMLEVTVPKISKSKRQRVEID